MSERDATQAALLERVGAIAPRAGLDLLLLFGSRARGDVHPHSDWDFGYLASSALEPEALAGELSRVTGSDRVDLADLARAGGLLRFRAARDGRVVFERQAGLYERFWLGAVGFWCDAAPVIGPAHEAVLERLGS